MLNSQRAVENVTVTLRRVPAMLALSIALLTCGCNGGGGTTISGAVLTNYSIATGATITSSMIAGVCNGTTPGTFRLPPGTVNFSTTLIIPSHCTIQGQGIGASTLLLAPGMSTYPMPLMQNAEASVVMSATLDEDITLEGFTLSFNSANQTAAPSNSAHGGLIVSNAEYVTIDHVDVNGVTVHIGGAGFLESATDATYTHDISLTNNYFHNAGVSPYIDADQVQIVGQNIIISHNIIGPSTDTGIAMWGGTTNNVTIIENYLTENVQQQITGAAEVPLPHPVPAGATDDNVVISKNTLIENDTEAGGVALVNEAHWTITKNLIKIVPTIPAVRDSRAVVIDNSDDVTVSGNTIIGSDSWGISIESYNTEESENVNITGNTIQGTNKQGIYIVAQSNTNPGASLVNIKIQGNSITDPGAAGAIEGIDIAQDALAPNGLATYTNVNIEGNTIVDDRVTPTMPYAIVYQGSPVVCVSGNNISGYTIAPYLVSGNPTLLTCTNGTGSADVIQAPEF